MAFALGELRPISQNDLRAFHELVQPVEEETLEEGRVTAMDSVAPEEELPPSQRVFRQQSKETIQEYVHRVGQRGRETARARLLEDRPSPSHVDLAPRPDFATMEDGDRLVWDKMDVLNGIWTELEPYISKLVKGNVADGFAADIGLSVRLEGNKFRADVRHVVPQNL